MKSIIYQNMKHRCTIYKIGTNFSGDKEVLATYTDVPCYVNYEPMTITKPDMEKVIVEGMIFFLPTAPLDPNHLQYEFEQTAPYSRKRMEVYRLMSLDDPRTGKTHHFEVWIR